MIQDSPAIIKGLVFPLDDLTASDVAGLILELVSRGRVFSLEVDKKRWLYRKDFRKEQRIYADESRLCQVDQVLLTAFDDGDTIPQLQVLDDHSQPQLFTTSTSSSTSTSPATSNSLTREIKKPGTKNGLELPWLDIPQSETPPGFFDRWKSVFTSKREMKSVPETPESVGELIEQAIGRRA